MILDNLKTSGVQQAHKEDKITFTSLAPWPGGMLCAEGRYMEGETERRAGIFIGPEFGTVSRQDLVQAAREAADADFDVCIACAFNYEAMASEFHKLGRINVLKARMKRKTYVFLLLAANVCYLSREDIQQFTKDFEITAAFALREFFPHWTWPWPGRGR